MGLFVAVFPPSEILEKLRNVKRTYNKQKRNLKFIPNDQLHITLKFIGSDVSDYSKEVINELFMQTQGDFGRPEIRIEEIRFGFPKETHPKFLLANIENTNPLKNTADVFHEIVKEQKFRDTVNWKNKWANDYHITIARLKKTATNSTAKLIKSNTKNKFKEFKTLRFIPEEAWLVNSYIFHGEQKYDKLERYEL